MSARTHRRRRGAAGFAMVTAVFLVVVLALLGALIVKLSATHQVGHTRDLLGTRAWHAARAGIEWGAYRALQQGSCAASSSMPALAGAAAGFTITVNCGADGPYDEAGISITVYRITATAVRGSPGSLDHTERQLVAVVSTP